MKRALRMFGNRLGNCTYDKVFLREVKNARPGTGVGVQPFIPANYPKPQPQNCNQGYNKISRIHQSNQGSGEQQLQNCEHIQNCEQIQNCGQIQNCEQIQINQQLQINQHQHHVPIQKHSLPPLQLKSPPTTITAVAAAFDESMFDNSMMISEEDLLSDENFSNLTDAAIIMEEEEFNTNGDGNGNGVYPLLPNKRK